MRERERETKALEMGLNFHIIYMQFKNDKIFVVKLPKCSFTDEDEEVEMQMFIETFCSKFLDKNI